MSKGSENFVVYLRGIDCVRRTRPTTRWEVGVRRTGGRRSEPGRNGSLRTYAREDRHSHRTKD